MRFRAVIHSFAENLDRTKRKYEAEMIALPDGPERNSVMQKIVQIDNAKRMDGWLSSDLRAPV